MLATRPITVTEATVLLSAPDEAGVGQSVTITWEGPDAHRDRIAVAKIGEKKSVISTPTRQGNPLKIQMPTEPGEYELRYVLHQDETILATRPITVTQTEVSIEAPNEAGIGESVAVTWVGPDENRDYIAVSEVGESGYINYTYTSKGNVLTVKMPPKPGQYEIRYVLDQGDTVLMTHPITVTEASVSLDAPAEARIGASIPVTWAGPDEDRDYIAVSEVGESGYINYTYTREGSVLRIQMPPVPGEYEIRYVLGQGDTKLASIPIKVTPATVLLEAPDEAGVGETISVIWEGPDERSDYISVAKIGGRYINYAYTNRGNPASIQMPTEPGDYEIQYVLDQRRTILLTRPITVK